MKLCEVTLFLGLGLGLDIKFYLHNIRDLIREETAIICDSLSPDKNITQKNDNAFDNSTDEID